MATLDNEPKPALFLYPVPGNVSQLTLDMPLRNTSVNNSLVVNNDMATLDNEPKPALFLYPVPGNVSQLALDIPLRNTSVDAFGNTNNEFV